jgi:hypothetical protein
VAREGGVRRAGQVSRVRSDTRQQLPTLSALMANEAAYPTQPLDLIQSKVVLLVAYDHSRTHESHQAYDFMSGEAELVNEIRSNESAGSTETSLWRL